MSYKIHKIYKIYLTLIMVLLLLATVSLSWADTITYGNVIRDALKHSGRIRVKAEDVNISYAVYRQNFAGLFPEISAASRFERHENLDHRNDGYNTINTINGEVIGGDASGWRTSAGLTGSYYFSHWYKKRFEVSYYERLRDMRVYECAVETKKVIQELTDIFSSVAEAKIKLHYGADILYRLREILYLKKQALAGGQISYEDVLKAEAEVATTEKELAAVRKEFHENVARLNSFTSKTYEEDGEVEFLHSSAEKPWRDYPKGIANTPEYKARVKEMEAARFKSKAAANNFWPDISLYGRYDFYGSSPNAMDSALRDVRESSYSAGVLISIPLFDGGVRKWQRKQNLYEIKRQEESIKAVAEEKGKDLTTLTAGYLELTKSLAHHRKLAEMYGKMLTITKKASALGERSLMDIMEMEKDSLTVERDRKTTEHALAAYEKRLALEMDYEQFVSEYGGEKACQ